MNIKTMEKIEIKQKLLETILALFPDSEVETDVLEYADLIDDLGMDSITFISIIVEIEDMFGITIPDEMLLIENFRNVDEIVRLIENETTTSAINMKNEEKEKIDGIKTFLTLRLSISQIKLIFD